MDGEPEWEPVNPEIDDEFQTLREGNNGTLVKGWKIDDSWVRGNFEIIRDGETVATIEDDFRAAMACAAVFEEYGEIETDVSESLVPVEVALDGNEAIASYLCGVHQVSREETAKIMDVEADTVTKYLNRFRGHILTQPADY